MPEEIVGCKRCWRPVVQDGKIRRMTRCQLTRADAKLPVGDLSIILQEQLRRLSKCDGRIVIRQAVQQVRTAHLR